MRLLAFITTCLLVESAYSGPTFSTILTEAFFPDSRVIYTAQHDIVNIFLPLNILNIRYSIDDTESGITLFFVEADIKENGERVDQGLYILKNGHVTKLLDYGRDIVADTGAAMTAYFAANDGIYSYNYEKSKAEKYGTVTDDLISIAKVNGSDVFYVVTKDNVLYKVTEQGTKKEKVDGVVNAKQIVLDNLNNLYYSTTDKKVYVLVGDRGKKIEGLPENPGSIILLKPAYAFTNGLIAVIDSFSYKVYENGRSEYGDFALLVKPTAYSIEAALIQFFGYKKKIYEYNFLQTSLATFFGTLRLYFDSVARAIGL